MSDGEILQEAPYHQLLASSTEFQDLVNAHKETAGSKRLTVVRSTHRQGESSTGIRNTYVAKELNAYKGDQLIKQEEREIGDTSFKPYNAIPGSEQRVLVLFHCLSLSNFICGCSDIPNLLDGS